MKPGSITYPEVKQMSKSEKSEIEKLGEKLQKGRTDFGLGLT